MELVKRGTPDDWELAARQAELARLERDLAAREQAVADFKSELAVFQARYARAMAGPYAELEELEAQMAEKAARLRPEDGNKQRKAEKARLRADLSSGRAVVERPYEPAVKAKATDELKRLYRELTKLVHPDLVSDPEERLRREAVMVEANAAYAEGDAETLTYLLGRWEVAGERQTTSVESAIANVMRLIVQAKDRLEVPARELADLEASPLAQVMRRAQQYEADGRDLLARLVGEVEEEQARLRKKIKALDRRLGKARG